MSMDWTESCLIANVDIIVFVLIIISAGTKSSMTKGGDALIVGAL